MANKSFFGLVFALFLGFGAFFLSPNLALANRVTIDSAVSTAVAEHNGSSPTTVFTAANTGYTFYVDSSGRCVYSKTTDGGDTWGTAVTVDNSTACLGIAVWYDQWTPGDTTGTTIHIATFIAADVFYRSLNTSGDTFGAASLNISGANQGGAFAAGANAPSITKATNGIVYVGIVDATDSFVLKCSTSCSSNISNWTEAGTNPFTSADNDWLILMPLASGDVLSIWWDASAQDILSREYEDGANAWQGSWSTVSATAEPNTTYDAAFSATLNKTTNNIYLAYADDANTLGAGNDDIKTATYNGTSWTINSDVMTNDPNRGVTGVSISYDMNKNDVYVAYTVQETANYNQSGAAYVARSTDGMATWSSEFGQLNTTADDIYGFRMNLMNTERLYATWVRSTPDDLFGATVADIAPSTEYLYVGQDGTQTVTLDPSSSNNYLGGAITFARTAGSANITSLTITNTGTLSANSYLSNLDIYYETAATCTYNGTETLFGTASSFNSSEKATVTGTMSVGTSQVCVYFVADIAAGAVGTIEIEIEDPNSEVAISSGIVPGTQRVRIQGVTNVRTPGTPDTVVLDSTVSTAYSRHLGASSTVVFTTDQIGYAFYVDSTNDCKYTKTTDGGATWSAGVRVDSINTTDCNGVAVWYDQWTPGDTTGTYIHVATYDTGNDDIYYTRFNTSGDTLNTTVETTTGQGFTLASGANEVTITKATNGALFVAIADTSDSAVFRCTTTCTTAGNWAETGTSLFALGDDAVLLMPLPDGDVMAIWWDASADDVLSKIYDAGTDTWAGSWTTIDNNAQDNTNYDGAIGATLNKTNNDIYLAYIDTDASSIINQGDDDIKAWKYSGGSWTQKTDVTTNDVRGLTQVTISYDTVHDDLYVIYSTITDVLNYRTGAVYYKYSDDDMATWSTDQGSITEIAEREIYGLRSGLMNDERIYATWVGVAADDLFGNTVVDISATGPTITISGTCKAYDQTTDCSFGAKTEARIAINGVLDTTHKGTIISGAWSITDVPQPSTGDVITIFIDNAADADEAVAVTKYSGSGDITGVKLYKEHIVIGSNQDTTVTNSDLALYDYSNDEDIYFEATSYFGNCNGASGTQALCTDFGNVSTRETFYIDAGDTFVPPSSGVITMTKLQIEGTYSGPSAFIYMYGTGTNTTCGATDQMPICIGSGGTFAAPSSTNYRYASSITVVAANYSALTIQPTASATATLGPGTFNFTGRLMMNACSNYVLDANTYDPTLNFNGNAYFDLGNTCGAIFNAGSSNLNFATVDYTNSPLQITGTSVFNGQTSTVTFTASHSGSDVNIPAAVYGNLVLNNASETYVATGAITATNLTITAGTFSSAYDVTAWGSVTGNGIINFTGGTFTHGKPGVDATFGGDSDWTFNNIQHVAGTFEDDPCSITAVGTGSITINGTFNLGGIMTPVFHAGSKIWNFTSSGTPFSGRAWGFYGDTSTFVYSGSGTTNIYPVAYNNLSLTPSSDSVTWTFGYGYMGEVESYNIAGNLNIGDGSHSGFVVDGTTVDAPITVAGDMTISANTTFSASDTAALTIGGDFTNNGTFTHNNGSVVIDTTVAETNTIGGSSNTAFYNFANTDPGSTLKFAAGKTYSFAGSLELNGAGGSKTNLQSTSSGQQWLATLTGTATLSQLNVKDSGCSESNQMPPSQTITNQGNNGTCWVFLGAMGSGGSANAPVDNGTPGGSGGTSGGSQGSGGGEDEGYQSHTAGTVVNDSSVGTVAWTNLQSTTASDFSYAMANGGENFVSNFIKFTNFGFDIPSGATVTGVKARIQKGHNSFGSSQDLTVKLVVDGAITGDNYANLGQNWPYAFAIVEHGGSTDLWGVTPTLTPAKVNASDFGLVISVNSNSSSEGSSTRIDYLELVVYYDYHDENGPGGSGGNPGETTSDSIEKGAGTGGNDASTGTMSWINTGNITALDGAWAQLSTAAAPITTNFITATNFGFAIPSSATITGIEVKPIVWARFTTTYDNTIQLIVGDKITGDNQANLDCWADCGGGGSWEERVYGGSTDLWGLTPSAADINASNFGIAISVDVNAYDLGATPRIDYVSIKVYYTDVVSDPGGGGGGASP